MSDASKMDISGDLKKVVDDIFEMLSDAITGKSEVPIVVTHWGVESAGADEYRVILMVKKKITGLGGVGKTQ
jgi:hypothetical protein